MMPGAVEAKYNDLESAKKVSGLLWRVWKGERWRERSREEMVKDQYTRHSSCLCYQGERRTSENYG